MAAPELWPHVDPGSVRNLRAGDSVTADLSRRAGDALARADLRGMPLPDGRPAYVVVPAEFQSRDDRHIPRRVREYAERDLDTLRRQQLIPAGDAPPVLPIVLYDGDAPWSTADGLAPLRPLLPEAAAYLGPFQPQAYVLLDLMRARMDDWPADNRLRAVARLLRVRAPDAFGAALAEELARFAGADLLPFRRALHAWAGELWTRLTGGGALPPLDELEGTEAPDMTSMIEARWTRWQNEQLGRARAEGRTDGVAEGLEHQRTMLRRQAERKFDPATGRELARRLANVADAGRLARAGDWIIDCDTGAALLERFDNGRE